MHLASLRFASLRSVQVPRGTDSNFASLLYKKFGGGTGTDSTSSTSNTARFSASSEEIASNQFCVNHYAGNVVYSTENFVEKNKDSIGDSLKVLSKSTLPFLRETVGKKLGQVKGNFKENCVARKFTKQVKKDEGGSESDGRATNPLLPSSPSCETNWSKPPPTSSGASSLTASCCL